MSRQQEPERSVDAPLPGGRPDWVDSQEEQARPPWEQDIARGDVPGLSLRLHQDDYGYSDRPFPGFDRWGRSTEGKPPWWRRLFRRLSGSLALHDVRSLELEYDELQTHQPELLDKIRQTYEQHDPMPERLSTFAFTGDEDSHGPRHTPEKDPATERSEAREPGSPSVSAVSDTRLEYHYVHAGQPEGWATACGIDLSQEELSPDEVVTRDASLVTCKNCWATLRATPGLKYHFSYPWGEPSVPGGPRRYPFTACGINLGRELLRSDEVATPTKEDTTCEECLGNLRAVEARKVRHYVRDPLLADGRTLCGLAASDSDTTRDLTRVGCKACREAYDRHQARVTGSEEVRAASDVRPESDTATEALADLARGAGGERAEAHVRSIADVRHHLPEGRGARLTCGAGTLDWFRATSDWQQVTCEECKKVRRDKRLDLQALRDEWNAAFPGDLAGMDAWRERVASLSSEDKLALLDLLLEPTKILDETWWMIRDVWHLIEGPDDRHPAVTACRMTPSEAVRQVKGRRPWPLAQSRRCPVCEKLADGQQVRIVDWGELQALDPVGREFRRTRVKTLKPEDVPWKLETVLDPDMPPDQFRIVPRAGKRTLYGFWFQIKQAEEDAHHLGTGWLRISRRPDGELDHERVHPARVVYRSGYPDLAVPEPEREVRPFQDEEANRCICDGAVYHTDRENAARRPFLVHPECPVHTSTGSPEEGPS